MDEKVAGVVTWKATAGENLNFAVPSKTVLTLLSNSTLQPLGTVRKDSVVTVASNDAKVWSSLHSGRDYKMRIDGEFIYVDWVNMPPALISTAAFMRSELKKNGDKWTGKVRSFLPYNYYANIKWCRMEADIEIDKISDTRIEGRAMNFKSINVRKCQAEKPTWESFAWIPK